MGNKIASLQRSTALLLQNLGERLRLARLRRRLTAKQVAQRAGMSPMTLRSLERGGAGVTIGAYAAVLQVLGLEFDLNRLAQEDSLGRSLQDATLSARNQPASASVSGAKRLLMHHTAARDPIAHETRRTGALKRMEASRSNIKRLSPTEQDPPKGASARLQKSMQAAERRVKTQSPRSGTVTSRQLAKLIESPPSLRRKSR